MSTLTASHGLTLSETGLKLIKAYEGFRPVDRTLVNGQRVVGYGHRLYDEKPQQVSEKEAEKILKDDLRAFEDMVNENVHAPLTQGQFDALVSLAYNIGPKAFLESDTLRALNNGRPLDAANGFDIWRKSVIDGRTYVVDALMRRRTAEKALFLKTSSVAQPASGADLPPVRDEAVALLSTEDALPVFTVSDSNGFVSNVPIDQRSPDLPQKNYGRRRVDGPVGALVLSEVIDENELYPSEAPNLEITEPIETNEDLISEEYMVPQEQRSEDEEADVFIEPPLELSEEDMIQNSIIAEAAADISERLDALIESTEIEEDKITDEWPDALLTVPEPPKSNLVAFPQLRRLGRDVKETQITAPETAKDPSSFQDTPTLLDESDVDAFIDNLIEGDAVRPSVQTETYEETSSIYADPTPSYQNSASRYVDYDAPNPIIKTETSAGYWAITLLGFLILCAAIGVYVFDIFSVLGEWGAPIVLSGAIGGSVMILAGIYYAIKSAFSYN